MANRPAGCKGFAWLLSLLCAASCASPEQLSSRPEELSLARRESALETLDRGFLKGVNLPWNHYGDFGIHPWWGKMYDPGRFYDFFQECKRYGVNAVRIWIFADGRTSPEWASEGEVSGLDERFLPDIDDMLGKAAEAGIGVIAVLWDFMVFNDHRSGDGPHAGMHGPMFWDYDQTSRYLDRALIPLVSRYKDNPALIGWEIMNEPEWGMQINGGGSAAQTIGEWSMRRFVARNAVAVHEHGGGKLVTVGSASWKFNSDLDWRTNYWSDDALKETVDWDSAATLDFYQVHYYDWMHPHSDPFYYARDYFRTGGKPVLIGEATPKTAYYSPDAMLQRAKQGGYAGVLFWSYSANDGYGSWWDFRDAIQRFTP